MLWNYSQLGQNMHFGITGRSTLIRGVSLLQLLASIVIMIVILSFSAASYVDLMVRKNIEDTSEALEIRINNLLRLSRNATSALALCAGPSPACTSKAWEDGFTSYQSLLKDGKKPKKTVIYKTEPLSQGVRIQTNVSKIIFLPGGFIDTQDPIKLLICSSNKPSLSIEIILRASGMIKSNRIEGPTTCTN